MRVNRTVMNGNLPGKIGIGFQQKLVPHFALASGVGKNNSRIRIQDNRNYFIGQFMSEMSCPRQNLHFIREYGENIYFLFLFGGNFCFFYMIRNQDFHGFFEITDGSGYSPDFDFRNIFFEL